MPHVLIVDDESPVRTALAEIVKDEGFTVAQASDLREAKIQILRQAPDLVLSDLQLPDGTGLDIFQALSSPNVDVVFITGHASVESAVDALRLGAIDYLLKPVNIQRLKMVLGRMPRNADLSPWGGPFEEDGRFGKMLGRSEPMKLLYKQIAKVAPTEATVLLMGDSGTGKELAAQAIHELSARRKGPFLPVNCGAISPNLIESEMFGHERGSFTGADRQHKGYFERAAGGTLFLDEITEMPVDLQVKLLRVLETGLFMRVGTNREIASDVRVVAATNRNPEEAVADGKLREDLYHRLNVFPLELPALRERGDDVLLIAQRYLDILNKDRGADKKFTPGTVEAMRRHAWPGNVRELKNYVHRAFILADDNEIRANVVPLQMATSERATVGTQITVPVGVPLADADRQLIFATLEQCGGVKKHAAEILGISLKTLYNRLEEYAAAGHFPKVSDGGGKGEAALSESK
ncbi:MULTISPECIES: sigma-54 dependent transcriptional regulator [unclassified Achromobacter]|uniref:sigma-54-dependent transcriptional regulator n=1 Tax=unclassified Achromobacter TaxID=2626865 RepID=UPI000B515D66|nr:MULTISPECIES: sigma-54 dependent transcriptional regulator [unclassified Achromobacter]OWT67937.1 sigma-54-dependent Fis family transcriptional regulator [Achromobacter sp. HZ34]OWT67989.1 sigma-54-dependent Fis family transcriptional regulator [Achromobacter sp. HZ28]